MAGQRIDGIALAAIGAGSVFAYAGIKDKSVLSVISGLIRGQSPATAGGAGAALGGTPATGIPAGAVGSGSLSAAVHGTYTNSQLQSLWIMAGGDPGKAAVAACIADHESSGNPHATSPNPDGGTNVGLWQLDTPGGKGAGFSVSQLMDPLTNARRAVAGSSNGRDWSAWSTAGSCGA